MTETYTRPATDLPKVETDRWTREGHRRFKATTSFKCGDGKVRTWDEWMAWQATRDPIRENPGEAADLVRQMADRIREERRGPGISRRPRPATQIPEQRPKK